MQATREENPEMAELAASLQISHFQRVCQHINYKYLQQVNCHKMKVVLAIKKHFYFFLRFQKDFISTTIFQLNGRPLLHQKKDTMTSFTQNVVCEHSLLFMQNKPYSLFSMQHGSFELSD